MRQESARHFQHPKQVDGQVLLDGIEIGQIVVDGDARVVHEKIEAADLAGRPLDLHHVGHVQRQGRHAIVGDLERSARSRVDPLRTPVERLTDKGTADAAVGAGDQDCLVRHIHAVHSVLLLVQG